jgi:hypothetical protein
LSDRDALSRLEYWVNDGARSSIALNATTVINGRSTLNFNNIALSNLDALPKMTAQASPSPLFAIMLNTKNVRSSLKRRKS